MTASFFSSFLYYTAIVAFLSSAGFLLGGFIFGPAMLDYNVRADEQASCVVHRVDYGLRLQHFLGLEGALICLVWAFAAVVFIIQCFCPGRVRGEERRLLSKPKKVGEQEHLVEIPMGSENANSNLRGGGLAHFGIGSFGEGAIVLGAIIFCGCVGVAAVSATYWAWGPGSVCMRIIPNLMKHCRRLLIAHWVICGVVAAAAPLLAKTKLFFWQERDDRVLNEAEQKRRLAMPEPNQCRNVSHLRTRSGLDTAVARAGDRGACVVFFDSTDTPACADLLPAFEGASEEFPAFTFVRVDADAPEGRRILRDFQVPRLPAVYVLRSGEVVDRLDGAAATPALLLAKLTELRVLTDL